ncbi:MAG: trypsin-like peptidase domain-containing protein [Emcibacter sp.]|nr:trypsin-like peptidase domain-containing protein [Emcibacter sp.]
MRNFYLWLSAFIIFTAIASSLPEKGTTTVPPIRLSPKASEKALPPLKRSQPEGAGQLKEKNRFDPIIAITSEAKNRGQIYTGTAFSLSEQGVWGTAQHVTAGCTDLVVLINARKGYRVTEVTQHPTADISILKTARGAKPFQIEERDLSYNSEGFHFGYPRGEPGNVYSRLIGRRIIKTRGARNTKESVLVWAEEIRQPDHNLSLGGISGGPILNTQGHLVGVHIAGSVRRGRSYSSLPETLLSLLQQTDYSAPRTDTEDKALYQVDHLRETGILLRKRLSVTKVICMVK